MAYETVFARQEEIVSEIQRIGTNFAKDPSYRKTSEYLKIRLETLDRLWGEFEQNNQRLETLENKSQRYFLESIYERTLNYYSEARAKLSDYVPVGSGSGTAKDDDKISDRYSKCKIDERLSLQRTNFRAFRRVIANIDVSEISEKWELEDELRNIQSRWQDIDKLHLEIDNILEGTDEIYQDEFIRQEILFKRTKKAIHQKLCATSHMQHATPLLEIPVFTGKYTQWPTFFDLFSESIHKNNFLSKAQKMQHLKGRIKGEAERLIQHLNISADNYDVAWEILTHRYNNPQVLFTTQIEIFLNQPNISKQTSNEIKRLYDTSTECIHAIHNLGVDTNTWDPILVHLITKKLDSETYSAYKEARKSPRDLASLEELLLFLESKFIALEPIHKRERDNIAHTKPASPAYYPSNSRYIPKQDSIYGRTSKGYQAAITYTSKCPLCHRLHELFRCKRFNDMTSESRLRAVARLNVCKNCLFKHPNEKCNTNKTCKVCNNKHHTLLHDGIVGLPRSTMPTVEYKPKSYLASQPSTSTKPHTSKPFASNHVGTNDEEVLLATVLVKVKNVDGDYVTLRALLDQGSQITLISENGAQLLGLPRKKFSASVSGIGSSPKQSRSLVSLECKSIYDDYEFNTEASIIPRVISDLPNVSFSKRSWPHLQHVSLADPEYNVSKSIDILLDACIYSDVIMSGLVKGEDKAPIAQQTKLGWILSGNIKTYHCNVVINNLEDIAKYWDLEEVPGAAPDLTSQELYCEQHYTATTRRLTDGRYEVALPLKSDYKEKLGSSKAKAVAQFRQLECKMERNNILSTSYKRFISDYKDLGLMRPASDTHETPCYLPHHGVMKHDSTTTNLRVVFNASSKTSTGFSLNDVMECGPNLQRDLPSLLLAWRQYKFVITADIEKMFWQILVREDDQHLQSFIWRNSKDKPLQEYFLTSVIFGAKAAPYQLAKDDAQLYPLASAALEKSFYMDDLLTGGNTIAETQELQSQLIKILKGAGMNLRKWAANDPELLNHLSANQLDGPFDFKCAESRKTLGLRWIPSADSFVFTSTIDFDAECRTKRQLLSLITKVFDPLGWLSPLTIRAKILFQKTWARGLGWDGDISTDIYSEWVELRNDLKKVNEFSIPRYLGNTQRSVKLYGHCDASEKAYAGVVYLVSHNDKGEYTSRLVAAKTKLAPLKKCSLPRLELCGALLLAQLIKSVKSCLTDSNIIEVFTFTDSMVVLGWLHGDPGRWKQFVANRVQQITEVIPASSWNHIRSEENAADCATRGLTVAKLHNDSLWWNGPEWMPNFDRNSKGRNIYESPTIEIKKACVNVALQRSSSTLINEILSNNSSITRAVKIVAWVSRFIATLCHRSTEHETYLSAVEINKAYDLIVRDAQANDFQGELESIKNKGHVRPNCKIASLNPYLDKNGILRVGGRLSNANISSTTKHPIILSNSHRLTDLLIHKAHVTTLHGGPRLTLSYVRERYWILSGLRTVKRQLRRCVKCRRFSSAKHEQIMADLPRARVTPSRPFTHTGVDFTGHVDLKLNRGRGVKTCKGYVAVFVCFATKAVHLELVSDLSTPAFLAAFSRFCARRGTPRRMYSDNGTNFVGAKRALNNEYKEILRTLDQDFFSNISEMNIEWSFNAPAWPTGGGLWERNVRSFKRHLKRVLGDQKLTYEEFTTLINQIEACLNSRPLSALTENPDDTYLTPGHFLIGDSILSRPQADPDNISLPTRWRLIQRMNKQFWKLWSSDYLNELQIRSKWRTPSKNLEINDIVVVKEDNIPPGKWPLGRVLELHPGKDNYVRIVSIKTQGNILKRPITKLIPLPVHKEEDVTTTVESQDHNTATPESVKKKAGRSKRSMLSNCVSLAFLLFTMLITPSTQQTISNTTLDSNQALYFDKISDLQFIRDEWKLVVYYNLTGYWQAFTDMDTYVRHLKCMTTKSNLQLKGITNQLTHELTEIEHYNQLLRGPSRRLHKRGLINGVGSVANYLFGVLDDDFAQQYAKDIEKISYNENHLKQLVKNQTTIIEAEYNIIQRNEKIMNTQFSAINNHLSEISGELNAIRSEVDHGLYITSSALGATIILENLRRMQTSLIDIVTDITHGRIDTHLLSSEQLEEQINLISGQLHDDLKVPVKVEDIRNLYKLVKVFARVYKKYLIIEVKIPLVGSEVYELDKIITIPRNEKGISYLTVPTYPYLAFNLRKDAVVFLNNYDIQSCLQSAKDKLLCTLDKPSYDLDLKQNVCKLRLINTGKYSSPCVYEQTSCYNRWVKLQRQNVWLYSCCDECNVRTFCPADMFISKMAGNGLVDIGQGCTLKGDSFTIYAHNNYVNKINIQSNLEAPEMSILNTVINTSAPEYIFTTENHERAYHEIMDEINNIKKETTSDFNIHDIHHYSISYGIVATLIIIAIIVVFLRIRRRKHHRVQLPRPSTPPVAEAPACGHRCCASSDLRDECSDLRETVNIQSVKRGVAPSKPPLPIPSESYSETVRSPGDQSE